VPFLLLLPLLVPALLACALLLVPLTLRQRYRTGHARRRAWPWLLRINAWGFLVSLVLFVAGAWLATHWSAAALRDAVLGTGAGLVLGLAGVALTRFHRDGRAVYYTPSRWMALVLTLLVASRVVAGLWWSWRRLGGSAATAGEASWNHWLDAGGVWAIGGLLLGYAVTFAWGVHLRHRALVAARDGVRRA
jgi:hypothetical protein